MYTARREGEMEVRELRARLKDALDGDTAVIIKGRGYARGILVPLGRLTPWFSVDCNKRTKAARRMFAEAIKRPSE